MSAEATKTEADLTPTPTLPEVPSVADKDSTTTTKNNNGAPTRKKAPTWSLRRPTDESTDENTRSPTLSLRKQTSMTKDANNAKSPSPEPGLPAQPNKVTPYSIDNLADVVKAWSKFKSSKKSTQDQALTSLVTSFIKLCDSSDFPASEGGVNSFGQTQIKELCAASARRIASQLTSLIAEFTPATASTSVLALSREPPQQIAECFTVLNIVLARREGGAAQSINEGASAQRRGSVTFGTAHSTASLEAWRSSIVSAIADSKLPSSIVFALEKLVVPRNILIGRRYTVNGEKGIQDEGSPEGKRSEGGCSDRNSSASDDSSCSSEKVSVVPAFDTKWGILATFLSLLCEHSTVVNELISSDALHTLFMISLAKCTNNVAGTIRDYLVCNVLNNVVV